MSYVNKNLRRIVTAVSTGFSDENFAEAQSYFVEVEKYLTLPERTAVGEAWRDVYVDGAEAWVRLGKVVDSIIEFRNTSDVPAY